MSTRYERRKAKRDVRAKLSDRRVRSILADEVKRGGFGTETFSVRHDGTGEVIYFNVSAMREWSEQNLEPAATPPNFDLAEKLVSDSTVDLAHIGEHTLRTKPKPIIICREVFGGDQIVDGSHRFVAFCTGCAYWQLGDAVFPAYVLERSNWEQFVIPCPVARACGFEKSYHSWLESMPK